MRCPGFAGKMLLRGVTCVISVVCHAQMTSHDALVAFYDAPLSCTYTRRSYESDLPRNWNWKALPAPDRLTTSSLLMWHGKWIMEQQRPVPPDLALSRQLEIRRDMFDDSFLVVRFAPEATYWKSHLLPSQITRHKQADGSIRFDGAITGTLLPDKANMVVSHFNGQLREEFLNPELVGRLWLPKRYRAEHYAEGKLLWAEDVHVLAYEIIWPEEFMDAYYARKW